MPIRINDMLTESEDERDKLLSSLINILTSKNSNECYSGSSYNAEKGIFMISHNLIDSITGKPVMKCICTIRENHDNNELIDIDVVIPNKNISKLKFQSKIEEKNNSVYEAWDVEMGEHHSTVETVNRCLINGDLQDKEMNVSLCAMPYGNILFAENLDKLNELNGFKPTKYKWQEQLGMGSEPLNLGFAPNFVGMGWYICKILNHRTVSLRIGESNYDCIIAELETGLGIMSAVFSIKYKNDVVDGHYLRMSAETKADFSCGIKNYYTDSAEQIRQTMIMNGFGLNELATNNKILKSFVNMSLENAKIVNGYYGNKYYNRYYKTISSDGKSSDALQVICNVNDDVKSKDLLNFDIHDTGFEVWEIKLLAENKDSASVNGLRRQIITKEINGKEGYIVTNVMNSEILPSYLEDDIIRLQMKAIAFDVDYYSNSDEYNDALKEGKVSDEYGTVSSPCFIYDHQVSGGYINNDIEGFPADFSMVSGVVKETYLKDVYVDNETRLTKYCDIVVETKYGDIELVHSLSQIKNSKGIIKGAIVYAKCIIQGDALIYEYENGLVRDYDNNLKALLFAISSGETERLNSIFSENIKYVSVSTKKEFNNKIDLIDYFKYVYNNQHSVNKYIYNDSGVNCIKVDYPDSDSQLMRIELDDKNYISKIIVDDYK